MTAWDVNVWDSGQLAPQSTRTLILVISNSLDWSCPHSVLMTVSDDIGLLTFYCPHWMIVSSGWAAFSLTHSMTCVVHKWLNSLSPTITKIMIPFCKAPKKLFIIKILPISLGANFQKEKAASFFLFAWLKKWKRSDMCSLYDKEISLEHY